MLSIPSWQPMVLDMLTGSPQDPVWHAEGCVGVHTRLVCERMVALGSEFLSLSDEDQDMMYRAALLHDIGKPSCTQVEGGHIRNHGHSRKGASMARGLLYGEGYSPARREAICTLIRLHMTPVHSTDTDETELKRRIIAASFSVPLNLLVRLAIADNRGRTSLVRNDTSSFNIEYFSELLMEIGCPSTPFKFKSEHSKFLYFTEGRDPAYDAFNTTEGCMYMMAGLPGSGKSTFIQKNFPILPVVSLDDLREKMRVEHGANQSTVVNAARELVKDHLRHKRSFVLDATNIIEDLRRPWIELATAYSFRTNIDYMEVPYQELLRRNKEREPQKQVPVGVIARMIDRWSVPRVSEAHRVTYHWGD